MSAFDGLGGDTLDPSHNPFSTEPGVPPPALPGRDPELRALDHLLRRIEAGDHGGSLFLLGARGLGKTSLLVETAREAGRRGITVVRVELSDDLSASNRRLLDALVDERDPGWLGRIAERVAGVNVGPLGLELRTGAAPGPTLAALILTAAAALPGGLLILLDETQEAPELAADVVRAAHRAAQDDVRLGVVLAGLPSAQRDVVDEVSYAERIQASRLRSLSDAEAASGIADPLEAAGIDLPADLRRHIGPQTGGYPYFVQLLGGRLWRHADHPGRITREAWHAGLAAFTREVDRWLGERVGRLSPAPRAYLEAAHRAGWPARTAAVAAALDSTLQGQSPHRATLIDDGVLWPSARGEVDLVIPPMARWLEHHGARTGEPDPPHREQP